MTERKKLAELSLTAGLVLVFGVFGIDKFLNPIIWIGWIPAGFEGFLGLSRDAWLQIVGVQEILLALLLLVPVRKVRRIGAALISLALLGIFTQVGWNDMGVRDLGLLAASAALFLLL